MTPAEKYRQAVKERELARGYHNGSLASKVLRVKEAMKDWLKEEIKEKRDERRKRTYQN